MGVTVLAMNATDPFSIDSSLHREPAARPAGDAVVPAAVVREVAAIEDSLAPVTPVERPAPEAAPPKADEPAHRRLNPSQRHVFDNLLAIGAERPVGPAGLADRLRDHIAAGTAGALATWTQPTLWLSKSQLFSVLRCEAQYQADARTPRRGTMHPATAIGIVTHRAIQIAHTHPGRTVADAVEAAVEGSRSEDGFGSWWESAPVAAQSDLISQATNRTTAFLDSWPTLEKNWNARFEDSFQARIGRLVLAARIDLVIGRPRADGRQTMVLCDLKTSSISDYHADEAAFYALVATLRHGIAPWRSTVFSLSSGEWVEPDVTEEMLFAAADKVIAGVNATVEVLLDARDPHYEAGVHCSWCPMKTTCPAHAEWRLASTGS